MSKIRFRSSVHNLIDLNSFCLYLQSGKEDSEIKRYYICFWLHYKRINDWEKVLEKIEKGERKILRHRQIRDIIQEKIERHFDETYGHLFVEEKDGLPTHDQLLDHAWQTINLKYVAGSKSRAYTEEEDAFLLCMMHRHGYGANERIRLEIRRAFQFRFNWYFKSRSSQDIQRRCESIVKMVEKEITDTWKAEEDAVKKQEADMREAEAARAEERRETARAAVYGETAQDPSNLSEEVQAPEAVQG